MPERQGGRVIRAAGAIVWRPGAAGPELALVHRPRYDDWSYPKGKCRRGEHLVDAAGREVAEETGLRVVLGRPLGPSAYRVGGRVKQVSYWAARCAESVGFVPGREVDQMAWLPASAARDRLTYQRDVALLDEFLSGPARTTPFILVRHASAGHKRAGPAEADLARPLDARGAAEAELLAGLLAWYGPCRVLSSRAERCLATVRPYAAAVAVPVEPHDALTVRAGEPPGAAAPAAALAASLAAAGGPVLICAHRENLPAIAAAACHALGSSPPAGPALAKGAFCVLQSAGGVLVSTEWHAPADRNVIPAR